MEGDKLFLTILRGSSPRDAQPVLATEDQEIIREVARALGRRLGLSRLKPTGGLELVHCHAEEDGDEE